ncbi:hypothetical protein OS493_012452 [Desmophyllum pertusum]|uniref:Uncharacterized protein n=1 Tax=Desmophyllum pertusum TaxID=174260 RepID=A0A9W9ZSD0_9CNID|nr:hypothetical protein OS493_012452 [Desmophyllum pertusum]
MSERHLRRLLQVAKSVDGKEALNRKGLATPRAFVDYDRLKDPEPRYFEEIIRNSLTEDEIPQFCADFLTLFRPKEHKQPVPCAIGSADSGKTSLFGPIFQVVRGQKKIPSFFMSQ